MRNTKSTVRVVEDASFWQMHFNQFKLTKLSKAEYARKHNLVKHRFIYWAHKFETTLKNRTAATSDFIPVTIKQTHQASDNVMPVLCTIQLTDDKKLVIHNEAALRLCLEIWK